MDPLRDKCTYRTLDIADIADINADIYSRWSKKSKLSLPLISELPGLLDKPLPQDEKIPLTRIQFLSVLDGDDRLLL